MEIIELTAYSALDVQDMDRLMYQLSATSYCNDEKLQAVMDDASSHLYVIRDVGRIVATATLCVSHTPEFTLGGVEAVVVDNECRGKGLAKALMVHLMTEAKRLCCVKLHLTSNPKRVAANELYRKIGFSLYATNYYELEL